MNNVVGLIVFLSQHLHHSPIMPVLSTCKYICNCCTDYCTVTTAGLPQSTLKPMVQSCENASQMSTSDDHRAEYKQLYAIRLHPNSKMQNSHMH